MNIRIKVLIIAFLMAAASYAEAEVRLPAVFGDGMVLQRQRPVTVWGWAGPGEAVTVGWHGRTYSTFATEEGRWSVELPASHPGGPYVMTVNDIEIYDILVGDVFLCSGQSNMELPVRRVTDMFEYEIDTYQNKSIRHYTVPKTFDFSGPQEDTPEASWKACTHENVMEFSALAYFFAKDLYEKTGVPVGIVNASWGGTPIAAWMSEDALKEYPEHLNEMHIYADDGYRTRIKQLEGENYHRWNSTMDGNDPGLTGEVKWYDAGYDDSAWQEADMFSKDWGNDGLNPSGGSHWLRKDIEIPGKYAGKEALIRLGCIVDADSVYVNGHFVGNTTYQYPPRKYRIPSGVLREGRNNVTVRVISNGGQPSFVQEKPYMIICEGREFSLEGIWKYHQGSPMPDAPSMMFFCYKPVCLYNAMIAPLKGLTFSGVIWYQGESDVDGRNVYADLLKKMTADWRRTFNDAELPFYIVELADFLHKDDVKGRQAWAEMREQQAIGAAESGNAVLIRNSDLGEWNDIHPLDKKTLGKRIAKAAGKNLPE
ncbi:MAG: sialate O-acetylesterase [Bacteroidales bacterium]|nr:sialate O-acetylesterase [Bacteroidales bacterium]